MFKTIKSKVLINVLLTLFLLITVIFSFDLILYQKSKQMIIDSFSRYTSIESQKINKKILSLENNALDLAVFGEVYYKIKQNRDFLEKFVIKIFENYNEALGGGIWFEPYVIDANKKFHCIYAFRNKFNQVLIDRQFETEKYNYLNRQWYKEIMEQLKKGKKSAWSTPYFEKEGSNSLMLTTGSGIYNNGKLVGMSTVDWEMESILKSILKITPTPDSFALFADKKNDYILASTDKYLNNKELVGKSLNNIPWYNENLINLTYFKYHNKKYIPYVKYLDNDMLLIINIPKWELFRIIAINVLGSMLIISVFCLIIFALLYRLVNKNILSPINKLEEAANKISQGESGTNIEITKPAEFAHLASTFTKMAKDIKEITHKQTKLESELMIAKSIQSSSLPCIFPPFPDIKEFNIYASMTAAKEVGGDFYDFYFVNKNSFMFLIADVSGKGIPAALFMMTVKTLISNVAQLHLPPKKMIEEINKKICVNNKEHLFVTMFAGIVDLETGNTSFINCGHNPPLICKKNSDYEYLKTEQNVVLGIFPNFEYNIFETKLNYGDRIFLYTDGITEAINIEDEMYGGTRLLNNINRYKDNNITEIANNIGRDINDFAAGTEQSDDITMLIFEYNGCIKSYKNTALKENYKEFYSWVNSVCDELALDNNLKNKINMCAEEIFANVCFYAYPNEHGTIEINISKSNNTIKLQFIDEGIQYNPLEKSDPDITLPLEERTPGGLGIYMVKQMTSKIEYEYKNNKNILILYFNYNIVS